MRGKLLSEHYDIKTFKRSYKKVPLANFNVAPVLAISMIQPQAQPASLPQNHE